MAVAVIMPELGESIVEGTIVRWLKQEGDLVKEDEPLVEIMTDKVNTELPAPASGVLKQILATAGATVKVGQELAWIETEARAESPAPSGPPPVAEVGFYGGHEATEGMRSLPPSLQPPRLRLPLRPHRRPPLATGARAPRDALLSPPLWQKSLPNTGFRRMS